MLFVRVWPLLFVLMILISLLLPWLLLAMIKSSFAFALFILLGNYYGSMDVSFTPLLDSLLVSNSYRFMLSIFQYIPYSKTCQTVRQAAGTTSRWRKRSTGITTSLIDNPCLLSSLDFLIMGQK
jgi:hypothetical protein